NIFKAKPLGAHFFGFGRFALPFAGCKDMDEVAKIGIVFLVKLYLANEFGLNWRDPNLFLAFPDSRLFGSFARVGLAAHSVPFAGSKPAFLHGQQNFVVLE